MNIEKMINDIDKLLARQLIDAHKANNFKTLVHLAKTNEMLVKINKKLMNIFIQHINDEIKF